MIEQNQPPVDGEEKAGPNASSGMDEQNVNVKENDVLGREEAEKSSQLSKDANAMMNIDPTEEVTDEDAGQYVTFSVGEEEYGVDILKIREIKGWVKTTRIPGAPYWVCGVVNLRGEVVPIIDIRARFEMGQSTPDESNVVVIVDIENRIIGLLVDRVSDIVMISEISIKPVPEVERTKDSEYLTGIATLQNRLISLLDLSKFVQDLGKVDTKLQAAS